MEVIPMANQEQLDILKQGSEAWNEWRKVDSNNTWVDLAEAELGGADLSGVNLSGGNLSGANFRGARLNGADLGKSDLSRAELSYANLSEAHLAKANLNEANLGRADLSGSDLNEANLGRADLSGAYLIGTRLIGAYLTEAKLVGAIVSGADLTEAVLTKADLNGVVLTGANLKKSYLDGGVYFGTGADLSGADLSGAHLGEANLRGTNLSGVTLVDVDFSEADLRGANLKGANLRGARFVNADLIETDLGDADLTGADLSHANLVKANISNAIVNGCNVYGVSVWDLKGEFKEQKEIIITPDGASAVTVDNIKVAQFMYLILNNREIRDVLNTLTSKSVLILGRFSLPERKSILDALRDKLREYDLLPIVFDFERPDDKDFTETIKTLAGLCYFVIADVTNPKSSPLELQATVPDYQIPFVPIIQEGEYPFAMMVDLQKKYDWVLETIAYDSLETLMAVLKDLIIDPAIKKHNELQIIKAGKPAVKSAKDFLKQKQAG
jgi:uncharacterized protein YjbI with pentapeptide repeats